MARSWRMSSSWCAERRSSGAPAEWKLPRPSWMEWRLWCWTSDRCSRIAFPRRERLGSEPRSIQIPKRPRRISFCHQICNFFIKLKAFILNCIKNKIADERTYFVSLVGDFWDVIDNLLLHVGPLNTNRKFGKFRISPADEMELRVYLTFLLIWRRKLIAIGLLLLLLFSHNFVYIFFILVWCGLLCIGITRSTRGIPEAIICTWVPNVTCKCSRGSASSSNNPNNDLLWRFTVTNGL